MFTRRRVAASPRLLPEHGARVGCLADGAVRRQPARHTAFTHPKVLERDPPTARAAVPPLLRHAGAAGRAAVLAADRLDVPPARAAVLAADRRPPTTLTLAPPLASLASLTGLPIPPPLPVQVSGRWRLAAGPCYSPFPCRCWCTGTGRGREPAGLPVPDPRFGGRFRRICKH